MTTPIPHGHQPDSEGRLAELQQRWNDRYGPLIARQLEPDRRYSLLRVGSAEHAYTDYDRYVRALSQTWSSGLVPEPLPSAVGSELLDVAPNLSGIDSDPARVRASGVEPPSMPS
jgi:hypothetical protein